MMIILGYGILRPDRKGLHAAKVAEGIDHAMKRGF
jgi:hypothetical protein